MASHIVFVLSGLMLLFTTLLVHSIPIEKTNKNIPSPTINDKQDVIHKLFKSVDLTKTTTTTTTTTESTTTVSQSSSTTTKNGEQKKKRFISDDEFDGLLDNESEESEEIKQTLHPKMNEVSAQIHDETDKLVDSDDSQRFSDIQMSPNELIDIVRRRRDVQFNDESNRRRKRALLPYEFYDTDSLYDPYVDSIEQPQYIRPIRSFAPLYWYPDVYERNVRSTYPSFLDESSDYPRLNSAFEDDNNYDALEPLDDDEDEYELNRYPILLKSSNNPFDNLQFQQEYNIDDLPVDEELQLDSNDDENDDEDDDGQYRLPYPNERPLFIRY